jgi:hypothetical protein
MVRAKSNVLPERQQGKAPQEPQPNPWHEMMVLSVLAALATLAVGMMVVSMIRLAWLSWVLS